MSGGSAARLDRVGQGHVLVLAAAGVGERDLDVRIVLHELFRIGLEIVVPRPYGDLGLAVRGCVVGAACRRGGDHGDHGDHGRGRLGKPHCLLLWVPFRKSSASSSVSSTAQHHTDWLPSPPINFDDFDDIGRRIANRFDEVFPPAAHVRQDYSLRCGGRTIENPTDIGDCVCRDVS